MPFFFSYMELKNKRAKQVLPGIFVTSGTGEAVRKWGRRVNIMQILYTHECKWKNDIC
jgi:hypothetical protein